MRWVTIIAIVFSLLCAKNRVFSLPTFPGGHSFHNRHHGKTVDETSLDVWYDAIRRGATSNNGENRPMCPQILFDTQHMRCAIKTDHRLVPVCTMAEPQRRHSKTVRPRTPSVKYVSFSDFWEFVLVKKKIIGF